MPGSNHVLKLSEADYDTYLSRGEIEAKQAALKSDAAFAKAMGRAIRRGREKVSVGTFIDDTPPIHAKRMRGDAFVSTCGSPAAACLE